MKLILLIVTVLGVGGPPGIPGLPKQPPDALRNATITVIHKGKTVAQSTDGQLSIKLKPGAYSVIARLADEPGKPPSFCQASKIDLRRTPRHLKMGCSIE
jgi:hypothetical protein